MMWVLVALAGIDCWSRISCWRRWPRVALLVSALTPAVLWLIGSTASFKRLPVLIVEGHLIMRAGRLREHRIPFDVDRRVSRALDSRRAEGAGHLQPRADPLILEYLDRFDRADRQGRGTTSAVVLPGWTIRSPFAARWRMPEAALRRLRQSPPPRPVAE